MTVKISALPSATTPAGTELVPVVQGGVTSQTTVDAIALKSKTLAELNTQVSDATLIDTGDSRLSDSRAPTAHALGGSLHSADTLANLNTKVSDATLARTDATQTFTGAQQTGVTTLTYGATIAIDASLNNAFQVTLTAAGILGNPSNAVQGMSWTVEAIQGGAGLFALTFGTNYVGPAVTEPLDTSADTTGQIRVLTCYAHSATKISVVDMGEAV